MKNRLFAVALSWCGLFGACAPVDELSPEAQGSDAIVHGTADRGRTPAVVALRTRDGALCSGALVAPDVVLTARHCVSFVQPEVRCESRGAQVMGDRRPEDISVVVGDDARTGTVAAHGASLVTPDSDRLCGEDLSLLRLDRTVRGITPLPLGLRRAVTERTRVRVVGYGLRGDSARAGVAQRFQRAHVAVTDVAAREFSVAEGPCGGDSGSPAIDEATGEVVGVLSRGSARCVGPDAVGIYTRVDVFAAALARALR